jgi:hypothetical protein
MWFQKNTRQIHFEAHFKMPDLKRANTFIVTVYSLNVDKNSFVRNAKNFQSSMVNTHINCRNVNKLCI